MKFIKNFSVKKTVAKANNIDIWYETFGRKKDPALLLIMGGLCQGILWPTEFCEKLASSGFFVIRYDHRDTGYSSYIDYEKNPYDLTDMAEDALGLLDYLGIKKAHLCALSMGGPIAELMTVHDPKRIATLTLMSTSCDFRPSSLGYDGFYPTDIALSRPKEIYLKWMQKYLQNPPQTEEEKLKEKVLCWSILNGTVIAFDSETYTQIHREFLFRQKHEENLTNHLMAIKKSFDVIQKVPHWIKVPTLIFHGIEDPIFPPDHGEALAKQIKGSKYILVNGFGHIPNAYFYDLFIENMKKHTDLVS